MGASAEQIDARTQVDRLIDQAVRQRASDVHLDPDSSGYAARLRVDGLLEPMQRFDKVMGRAIVTRLMVMAELLTYRLDIPQEGRLAAVSANADTPLQLRLAVMPTTHGLRAVLRLPAELTQPHSLDELNLPPAVLGGLKRFAETDTGLLLLTGPAGSGKTTTIYALLEHIVATQPGVSVISLEDPVERDLQGVTQIQVTPHGQLSYERALRSILRQDPQVLMLGEIRDAATASIAVQAALSGHRLIATLHAGSPATAIARLLEMDIEPYQITSALYGVVAQRLLRRLDGARHGQRDERSGGYFGRVPVAEIALMNESLRSAILARADAAALGQAIGGGSAHVSLIESARAAVAAGLSDEAELRRVFGQSCAAHA